MYAKLVVGASNISVIGAMRDIGRLITSATPNTSLLGAFSNSSSIVVDSTAAGWTYVGSVTAADQPTIANTSTSTVPTADVEYNLCFSAPCLASNTLLKYCSLTNVWRSNTNVLFALTGATNATSAGVLTNEGPRHWQTLASGSLGECLTTSHSVAANKILHLVATQRHVTIIEEGRGMSAVWEASQTDAHTFYGKAPFVQYSHCDASVYTREDIIVPTAVTTTRSNSILTAAFDITDPNTGTTYGTYDLTENQAANPAIPRCNINSLVQGTPANCRVATINASGSPRYCIGPVFYSVTTRGYPTQYVTGIVPIYWTGPDIGTTGDTVDVNGDTYTYFNCGTANFGVIMKTS